MNSSNGSFNPSHEAGGDQGAAPKQMSQIPSLTLNDGNEIPMLAYGLGTKRALKGDRSHLDEKLVKMVVMAIKAGYHHLDGAEVYGNEAELGAAIKESGVPREKLFVTTKIWDSEPKDTSATLDASLRKLQLDYVDLYLVHTPFFFSSPAQLQQKWADMEAIQASGRARSIGVSNFIQKDLDTLLQTAKVVPAVNQIEFHPYLQHGGLLDFCRAKGIATAAYAPLSAITKASPGPVDDVYARLAHKYGVTESEIGLRWALDRGVVAVSTSEKETRLKAYQKIALFKLTPREVEEISEAGGKKNFRGFFKDKFESGDFS